MTPADFNTMLPRLLSSPVSTAPFIWLGTFFAGITDATWTPSIRKQMNGYIGFAPTFEVTEQVKKFKERAQLAYPALFDYTDLVGKERDFVPYDTFWLMALAMKSLWLSDLPNTGYNLLQAIRNITYRVFIP
jgi:hypothetical protein